MTTTQTGPRRVPVGEVELAVRTSGGGPPVVLVHGSLDDHRAWDRVAPALAATHTVVRYDRRGHGSSTCPPGQGRISEDVADLAGLLHALELDAPLVVGHSYGASVALLLAATHPELTGGLLLHEPPLFGLLRDDQATHELAAAAASELARAAELITAGDVPGGVEHFVERAAFGPGTWDGLFTDEIRRNCVAHADTWLDQSRDPERLAVRPELLAGYPGRVVLSHGDSGLPVYDAVVAAFLRLLPATELRIVAGAGHAPHLSHPAAFAALIADVAGAM